MTDREKVIKGLEHCKCRSGCNSNCPYSPIMEDHNFGIDECTSQLADDALSLLKAQKPKTVKEMLVVGGHLMGKCPRCSKILTVQDYPVSCGFCGQAVKWE